MSDINDPWGSAADLAVKTTATPVLPTGSPAEVQAALSNIPVSNIVGAAPSEGKLTLTFKGTGTFADRWLVAHVANPADGLDLLKDPQFKELLDLSKKIAAYDSAGASKEPLSGPGYTQRSSAPQGATQPPAWAPPKHESDAVYKTGVSAGSGKTWHAWMSPQKGGYEPKFFYPPN